MTERVLFRVDGGKVWGVSMGHIKRSLLLADVLRKWKHVVYLMKDYLDGVAYVKDQGYEVACLDVNDNDDENVIKACEEYSPATVIMDLYETPYQRFFSYARENSIKTVVFDVLGKCNGAPDILFNDSFVQEFTEYPHLQGKSRLFIGPEYFLIGALPEIMPLRKTVQDIIITMGGSDPAGLTVKVLRAVLQGGYEMTINVVLGPTFTEAGIIYDLAAGYQSVRIYENPKNFLELLAGQDIVLCAAGRTLFECAYLGRPVIVVPSIDHEEVTASRYAELTGCFDVGLWDDANSPKKLNRYLKDYAEDSSCRSNLFARSRSMIDGFALQRILTLIEE